MATTTLRLWSEGHENDQCGIEIAGLKIGWAEIELAENRAEAQDMGVTPDLCDDYEREGGTYQAGTLCDWLQQQAAGDDATICVVCQSATKRPGQQACESCLDAAYDRHCPE